VVLYLAWRLRDVLRLAIISVFLALAPLPVVDAIEAHARVPRAAVIVSV
jgi:predicted PurR-regulated permease PerM